MTEAYILDAVRTPVGRLGGALASVRPDDLATVGAMKMDPRLAGIPILIIIASRFTNPPLWVVAAIIPHHPVAPSWTDSASMASASKPSRKRPPQAGVSQFPSAAERARPGGSGIYYHLSYLGAPMSYLWLGTTPPALSDTTPESDDVCANAGAPVNAMSSSTLSARPNHRAILPPPTNPDDHTHDPSTPAPDTLRALTGGTVFVDCHCR